VKTILERYIDKFIDNNFDKGERKKEDSKKGFSIGDKDKANKLDRLEKTYFYSKEFGIGKLLDDIFRNKLHDLDDSSADKTLKDKIQRYCGVK